MSRTFSRITMSGRTSREDVRPAAQPGRPISRFGRKASIAKPFHYPELVARMSALLRRTRASAGRDVVQAAGINLDLTSREVFVSGEPVSLSAKEFMLLAALAREPRRVFRKQELLESVWGYRSSGATRTLDSHASRLRQKLSAVATDRSYISNVWGIGYRLVAIEDPA
jgi:DNA-binding response OmpR family regulator